MEVNYRTELKKIIIKEQNRKNSVFDNIRVQLPLMKKVELESMGTIM